MKSAVLLAFAVIAGASCAATGGSSIEEARPVRDGSAVAHDAVAVDVWEPSIEAGSPAEGAPPDAGGGLSDSGRVDAAIDASAADSSPACDGGSSACSLLDSCALGAYRCSDAGAPQCVAVGTKPNGSFCGFGRTCQAGLCVQGVPAEDVVLIAKYVESGYFKAIVLWNPGVRAIDLGRYGLCLQSNQYTSCNWSVMLGGSLAAGGTFVLCNGSASPDTQCDVQNTDVINFNGDDRVGLYFDVNQNGRVDSATDLRADHFGEPGVQPPSQLWADKTYRRFNCVPYTGGRPFDVAEYFDDVSVRTGDAGTFHPDRTALREAPTCR